MDRQVAHRRLAPNCAEFRGSAPTTRLRTGSAGPLTSVTCIFWPSRLIFAKAGLLACGSVSGKRSFELRRCNMKPELTLSRLIATGGQKTLDVAKLDADPVDAIFKRSRESNSRLFHAL